MGLLDGLINRLFKTGQGSTASGEDPAALVSPRAAIRLVGATITDVPDYNRIDVEYPTPLALSSATPAADSGAGSAGVATTAARGDHVHPAGATSLDPVGTLTLAGAFATAVRIGDDAPSHRPSFSAWHSTHAIDAFDGFAFTSASGQFNVSAINTSSWNLEEWDVACTNQLYLAGFRAKLSENEAGEHSVTIDGDGVLVESDQGAKFGGLGATLSDGLGTVVDAAGVHAERRTGNNAANRLALRGGQSSSTAAGANTVGGTLDLSGGAGLVPGTDLAGAVRVALGRTVASNASAALGLYYADASNDDWEHLLLSVSRDSSARCLLAATPSMVCTSVGQFVVSCGAEVQLEGGYGGYGSIYVGNGFTQHYVPGGDWRFLGPSVAYRFGFLTPVETAHVGAGATTIATIACSASYLQIGEAHVMSQDGAGNWAQWKLIFTLDANGTATWGHWTATLLDSGGTGSGWTCTNTTSVGNALIQVAAAAAVTSTINLLPMSRNN